MDYSASLPQCCHPYIRVIGYEPYRDSTMFAVHAFERESLTRHFSRHIALILPCTTSRRACSSASFGTPSMSSYSPRAS